MIDLNCKCGTTVVTAEAYYALPTLKCETCEEQKQVRKSSPDRENWNK